MKYKNVIRSTMSEFAAEPRSHFTPRDGWIKHARQNLGVSAAWLAARLGITQSSVATLERHERESTITLSSLRRAADALGYDVAYSFVPRTDPSEVRARQAERAARAIVNRVAHSMELEDQAVSPERTEALVEKLAADLLQSGTRRIWDVESELP